MKKDEQFRINAYVKRAYHDLISEWCETKKPVRLGKWLAWVTETQRFYVLISQGNIVAFIDKESKLCYDILRYNYGYTNIRAQHIAAFIELYGAVDTLTYRPVKGVSHD